jgi:hypothetical protein
MDTIPFITNLELADNNEVQSFLSSRRNQTPYFTDVNPQVVGPNMLDGNGARARIDARQALTMLNSTESDRLSSTVIHAVSDDQLQAVPNFQLQRFNNLLRGEEDTATIPDADLFSAGDLIFNGVPSHHVLTRRLAEGSLDRTEHLTLVEGCTRTFFEARQNYGQLAGVRNLRLIYKNIKRHQEERDAAIAQLSINPDDQPTLLVEIFSYFDVDHLNSLIQMLSSVSASDSLHIAGPTFFKIALPLFLNFGPLRFFFLSWIETLTKILRVLWHARQSRSTLVNTVEARLARVDANFDAFVASQRSTSSIGRALSQLQGFITRNRTGIFISSSGLAILGMLFKTNPYLKKVLAFLWRFGHNNNSGLIAPAGTPGTLTIPAAAGSFAGVCISFLQLLISKLTQT